MITKYQADWIIAGLFLPPALIIGALLLKGETPNRHCYVERPPSMGVEVSPSPGLTPPASSIHCTAP